MDALDHYVKTSLECWKVIMSLRGVFELHAFQEYLEFAFSEQLLDIVFSLSL
jgi:hypothetical protein